MLLNFFPLPASFFLLRSFQIVPSSLNSLISFQAQTLQLINAKRHFQTVTFIPLCQLWLYSGRCDKVEKWTCIAFGKTLRKIKIFGFESFRFSWWVQSSLLLILFFQNFFLKIQTTAKSSHCTLTQIINSCEQFSPENKKNHLKMSR